MSVVFLAIVVFARGVPVADGPVIINVWKVQLGETGRGDLKRDISERISAFPFLKATVNAVSKLKAATVDQLVVISEIVGLLKRVGGQVLTIKRASGLVAEYLE